MKRRDFVRFLGVGAAVVGGAPLIASEVTRDNFLLSNVRDVSKKMLEEIYKTNAYYKKNKNILLFRSFIKEQHPRVTLIGCSDSRFQIGAIDDTPENDIFVIRNIGNQLSSNIGSVEYGVRHLHTPLLIVMGHARCGAIKAAMSDYSKESVHIKKEIDSLCISIQKARGGMDDNEKWLNAVAANVHQQVADVKTVFEAEVKSEQLTIVGMIYDFANDLKEGYGALKIVNVNGETDINKIRETPIFRGVKF